MAWANPLRYRSPSFHKAVRSRVLSTAATALLSIVIVLDSKGIGMREPAAARPDSASCVPTQHTVLQHMGSPGGVAVDTAGNVYVTDSIRGMVLEEMPRVHGGYPERVVSSGLNQPIGVAVDAAGAVYVVDSANGRVVKETPGPDQSYTQTTVAAALRRAFGLAVDARGAVYIAEIGGHRVLKETPTARGGYSQTVVGTKLATPSGLAVDGRGDVFVVDYSQKRLLEETPDGGGGYTQRVLQVRTMGATAVALGVDGALVLTGPSVGTVIVYRPDRRGSYRPGSVVYQVAGAQLIGVAVDPRGAILIADIDRNWVGREMPNARGGYDEGMVVAGLVPTGVAVDAGHAIYMTDGRAGRMLRIAPGGHAAEARVIAANLHYPSALTADASGNLYLLAYGKPTDSAATVIVKETPRDGAFVQSTIHLKTPRDPSDPLADLSIRPWGIAVDPKGAFYVADDEDVFVVLPDGRGGFKERLVLPNTSPYQAVSIAMDRHGDLFLGEDNTRSLEEARVVEEIPDGQGHFRERVAVSNLSNPFALAVDGSGALYISTGKGMRLLKETPNARGGYDESTLLSGINKIQAIAVDPLGTVYVADGDANRILAAEGCARP